MAASKLLAALLAAILVAAHVAAAFRTTITTVETTSEESSNYTSQECMQELMGKDLSHCMRYLMEQQSPYGRGRGGGEGRGGMHFNACCGELRKVRNERCRCEGIEEAMQQMRGRQEMQGVMRTAENLPNMCGVGPSMCRFQSPWF